MRYGFRLKLRKMFSAFWCETNECVDDGISVPKRAKKYVFHSISSSNRNLPVDLEVDNFLNDPLKTKESILKFPK